MNLKSFLQNLSGRFVSTCKRFWLPIVLLLALAVYSLVMVNLDHNIISDTFSVVSVWYLVAAALLMLSAVLWMEDDEKLRPGKLAMAVIAHIALLVWSLRIAFMDSVTGVYGLGMASITLLIVFSIFYLSFTKQKNDLPVWNFAMKLILGGVVSGFVTGVLMGGVMLLLKSFEMLFGLHIDDKAYADVAVLSITLVAPVLFLLMLPSKEEKYDNRVILSRFGRGVINYLFIPLLCAYIVVLYLYAIKIIAAWELPVGWVSYLVSALMLGSVIVIGLLYPIQFSGEQKKIDRLVFRWLPVVVLPLLALMTVGIRRRVGDYGITISRLYLVIFNLWCYAVCIFLIIGKSRRIWWIPVSFAVVLFFASVGPQNVIETTRRSLQREVKALMTDAGETVFPLDSAKYEALLKKAEPSSGKKIDDKLEYLLYNYDERTAIESLVDSTVSVGYHFLNDSVEVVSPYYNRPLGILNIPDGYGKVYSFNNADISEISGKDSLMIKIPVESAGGEDIVREFVCSKEVMKRADDSRPFVLTSGDAQLHLNSYSLNFESDTLSCFWCNGLMFLK